MNLSKKLLVPLQCVTVSAGCVSISSKSGLRAVLWHSWALTLTLCLHLKQEKHRRVRGWILGLQFNQCTWLQQFITQISSSLIIKILHIYKAVSLRSKSLFFLDMRIDQIWPLKKEEKKLTPVQFCSDICLGNKSHLCTNLWLNAAQWPLLDLCWPRCFFLQTEERERISATLNK